MKTLNSQYKSIKEGKGHKGVFLNEAKRQFPQYIRNAATYDEAVNILKDKGVINENLVPLQPINTITREKSSYENAFEKFLQETKEENDPKAEEKKISKQVEDTQSKMFNKQEVTVDTAIYEQFRRGFYVESCDPKNLDKTVEQIKDIVLKNLKKDPIYYVKDGQFGVEGIGYETEVPGLGTPKEPKGPHKSSGYGNLKENLGHYMTDTPEDLYEFGNLLRRHGGRNKVAVEKPNGEILKYFSSHDEAESWISINDPNGMWDLNIRPLKESHQPGDKVIYKGTKYEVVDEDEYTITLKDEKGKIITQNYNQFKKGEHKPSLQEQKLRKVINNIIRQELISENKKAQKTIAEIEKEAKLAEITTKVEALSQAIEERTARLSSIEESEDMKELMDKKALKELKKEIAVLEKYKKKCDKLYEKISKNSKGKEIIDEDPIEEAEGDSQDIKDMTDSAKELNSELDKMSKIELFEEYPEEGTEEFEKYLEAKEAAEERADAGEDIESIVEDFPEFKELLYQDLKGKYEGSDY